MVFFVVVGIWFNVGVRRRCNGMGFGFQRSTTHGVRKLCKKLIVRQMLKVLAVLNGRYPRAVAMTCKEVVYVVAVGANPLQSSLRQGLPVGKN